MQSSRPRLGWGLWSEPEARGQAAPAQSHVSFLLRVRRCVVGPISRAFAPHKPGGLFPRPTSPLPLPTSGVRLKSGALSPPGISHQKHPLRQWTQRTLSQNRAAKERRLSTPVLTSSEEPHAVPCGGTSLSLDRGPWRARRCAMETRQLNLMPAHTTPRTNPDTSPSFSPSFPFPLHKHSTSCFP